MKLNTKERLAFAQLAPETSSIIIQTLARDVNEKVQLSQKEISDIGLKPSPDGRSLTWKKEATKDISFTDAEMTYLKEQVTRLDTTGKVTQNILSLCIKIKEGDSTSRQADKKQEATGGKNSK